MQWGIDRVYPSALPLYVGDDQHSQTEYVTAMAHAVFRRLDLNLLRVFDAVMAEQSLTRAAHKLSLTQPAVSNALRRLREALGDDLVRRSGGSMQPTAHAQALWPGMFFENSGRRVKRAFETQVLQRVEAEARWRKPSLSK